MMKNQIHINKDILVKIKLLLCLSIVSFLSLQGQDKDDKSGQLEKKLFAQEFDLVKNLKSESSGQLKQLRDAVILRNWSLNQLSCVFSYAYILRQTSSAQEMFATSQRVVEIMFENYSDHTSSTCALIIPNEKLEGSNDMPMLKLHKYTRADKKWSELLENCNPSREPVTDWKSQNCKFAIYNIPNNNIMSMERHLQHIQWLINNGLSLIVNIDSSIKDNSVRKALNQEQKISAILGVHLHEKEKKKRAIPFYQRGWFQYGSAIVAFILFCFKWYRYVQWEKAIRNDLAGGKYNFWSIW